MTWLKDNTSTLRRRHDFPLLVVSQDYELFFQRSGSIEKCLFEPCDLLSEFASKNGIQITFFVDAGMLCRMERVAATDRSIAKDLSRIKRHIKSLANQGHEIGLHIHPHWEDTHWNGSAWDFSGARYRLRDFSDTEVEDIVSRYAFALNDLCDGALFSYRAGGFCIEPFDRIARLLLKQDITIDSSVVPGALLIDPDKGFDFSRVEDTHCWHFSDSPLIPDAGGEFLEVAVTPQVLPLSHYWGRAVDRVLGRQPAAVLGDGSSKAIGRREIVRRLAGAGRTSELSIDAPKAGQLLSARVARQKRDIWHVMGHPKLLGKPSLQALATFIEKTSIERFETVSSLARAIRAEDATAN